MKNVFKIKEPAYLNEVENKHKSMKMCKSLNVRFVDSHY